MAGFSDQTSRAYHLLGVPLRTGSLAPGSEDDATAYRDAHLLERLRGAGCTVQDDGDVPIPSYLPHHMIPPIRNWPGPRIVWDAVSDHLAPLLEQSGHVPLLIGCDCSIVVGTAQALRQTGADDVHVLYVDGDYDDAAPDAERCQSAAALAVWLLAHASPFWAGPALHPSQVTMVGASGTALSDQSDAHPMTLTAIREAGPRVAARRILQEIPPSAAILLHVDVDVLRKRDMPAAYFTHEEGLCLTEAQELLSEVVRDPRIRIIEVSEYAELRDPDRTVVASLVDLLAASLKP